MCLQIRDGAQQFLGLILIRRLLWHGHVHVNDWHESIELKIVGHILQVQFLKIFHENQCDGIVIIMAYVVNKVLINGRVDLDSALVDFFNNIGMLLNTLEQILRLNIWHY
jgi:hypothetical protein